MRPSHVHSEEDIEVLYDEMDRIEHHEDDVEVELPDATQHLSTSQSRLDDELLALAEPLHVQESRLLDEEILQLAMPISRHRQTKGREKKHIEQAHTSVGGKFSSQWAQPAARLRELRARWNPVTGTAPGPSPPHLARPAVANAPVVSAPVSTTPSSSSVAPAEGKERRSLKPKHRDYFHLHLSEYAEWFQTNYTPGAHGGLFVCQSLRGETVYLAALPSSTESIDKERLIVIRRLGGVIITCYDPSRASVIAAKSSIDERQLIQLLGVEKISDVPEHIKIYNWEWMVECVHAATPEVPAACSRHVLYAHRHPPANPAEEVSSIP